MSDEQFMQRALQLAQLGLGLVSPNPMVGCVVVHEGKIVGEGYHEQYGGLHAEVNALNAVRDQSLLRSATVYVTLEPCSHFGKTPPCADLLVRHRVARVVICNHDPNPLVAGKGIERLREAGIPVEVGLLEAQGLDLNKRFFTAFQKARPYVILKWAQTSDGFVARENYDSKWISNAYSRQLVHKWRTEEDAILIGKHTARYDNPTLTSRDWKGKNPLRVVLDRQLELDSGLHLFDGSSPTVCLTERQAESRENLKYIRLSALTPAAILGALQGEGVQSVLVEGGSQVLNGFISGNLWDEARVFISGAVFENGIKAPDLRVRPVRSEAVFDDRLDFYKNEI